MKATDFVAGLNPSNETLARALFAENVFARSKMNLKRLSSKLSEKSFRRMTDSIRSITPRRSPSRDPTTHMHEISSYSLDVISASDL
jgi:hypothetical protein